ncbi:MAG: BrnT family toxin [Roseiarcus sp.]
MTKLLLSSILMNDGKFPWDERKVASNVVAHGVTFDAARDMFTDPFAIEQLDDRENYGEDRFTIIGMARGRVLFVAYTMRGESIRIISARGAEPYERREYHEQDD